MQQNSMLDDTHSLHTMRAFETVPKEQKKLCHPNLPKLSDLKGWKACVIQKRFSLLKRNTYAHNYRHSREDVLRTENGCYSIGLKVK